MTIRSRRVAALGLVLASVGAAAAPAAGVAAAPKPIKVNYNVKVANGDSVRARVTVRNPESSVKEWWNRATISKVVRKGVNNGYEMPYRSQGYSCVPTVSGNIAHFTCKLQGADVPTTVTLRFSANYGG